MIRRARPKISHSNRGIIILTKRDRIRGIKTSKNKIGRIKKDKAIIQQLGGLHVIGTERHESRRIDNQLRGRSGRQGDPGSSRFFLSLEHKLLRLFGGDQILDLMQNMRLNNEHTLKFSSYW